MREQDELIERDTGWRAERALCVRCEHRWVAVFPDDLTVLECPRCGVFTGIPDHAWPEREEA